MSSHSDYALVIHNINRIAFNEATLIEAAQGKKLVEPFFELLVMNGIDERIDRTAEHDEEDGHVIRPCCVKYRVDYVEER